MSFTTSSFDPGSSPTTPCAVDSVGGAQYQRTKLADPTEGNTGEWGNDAAPMRVRPRRRGTADYDSGLVAVTSGSPASVTATTIYPEGGTVSNTNSTGTRTLTLTDAAGNAIGTLEIPAKNFVALPVPRSGSWAGLKAGADGTGVVLQVAGSQ